MPSLQFQWHGGMIVTRSDCDLKGFRKCPRTENAIVWSLLQKHTLGAREKVQGAPHGYGRVGVHFEFKISSEVPFGPIFQFDFEALSRKIAHTQHPPINAQLLRGRTPQTEANSKDAVARQTDTGVDAADPGFGAPWV